MGQEASVEGVGRTSKPPPAARLAAQEAEQRSPPPLPRALEWRSRKGAATEA
jgi:hypothetical protein